MRSTFRLTYAAMIAAGAGFFIAAGAGAQTSVSGIDSARANPIVQKPLVTSTIDLTKATAQPLPTAKAPITPDAALRLAQASPSKKTLDLSDTGNPSVAPVKWVGLVMTRTDKTHYSYCTGQFIAPRVVLTAGHCVKDLEKGTWNDVDEMSFILQYQNGAGSHVYKVVCTATLDLYNYPPNYAAMNDDQKAAAFVTAAQSDFAMILVDSDSLTGTIAWQGDWKGNWVGATRIGYPDSILSGEVIQQSHGIVFFADAIPIFTDKGNLVSYPNLVVHWQGNTKLTQGSSGGAWIANFTQTEGAQNNIAIGVTSIGIDGFPGAVFGPYLQAKQMSALLQFTKNGCKDG